MERITEAIRQMAHDLYSYEPRAENGVLNRIFEALQRENIIQIRVEAVSLDSTMVKVHPDGTGALKKTVRKPLANQEEDGPPKFIWLPRVLEQQ